MNFSPKHLFDIEAAGQRLHSLCASFIWSGIILIAVFQIGLYIFPILKCGRTKRNLLLTYRPQFYRLGLHNLW